jgi:hypothetical protein
MDEFQPTEIETNFPLMRSNSLPDLSIPDPSLPKDYEFDFFVEVSMLEIYNETVTSSSFHA